MSVQAITYAFSLPVKPAPRKLVLLAIANRISNDTSTCFPGQRILSEDCTMGNSTLRRHLSDLKKEGVIEQKRRNRQDGKRTSDAYTIVGFDEWLKEAKSMVKTTAHNRAVVKKPSAHLAPSLVLIDEQTYCSHVSREVYEPSVEPSIEPSDSSKPNGLDSCRKKKLSSPEQASIPNFMEASEPIAPESKYAFQGRIIRLTHGDFKRWEDAWPELNLRGELEGLDIWYDDQPDVTRSNWFHRAAGALKKADKKRLAELQKNAEPELPPRTYKHPATGETIGEGAEAKEKFLEAWRIIDRQEDEKTVAKNEQTKHARELEEVWDGDSTGDFIDNWGIA